MRLTEAKGNQVKIKFGGRKHATFTAGGRKRYLVHTEYTTPRGPIGLVMVNARLRFADGTEAYGVVELDESSSGEHSGTGVFLPDGGIAFQGDKGFLGAIGKTARQAYPYRYRYTGNVKVGHDHHIGDDGWSL